MLTKTNIEEKSEIYFVPLQKSFQTTH